MTDERPKARCLWWSVILVGAGLTWAAQALVDPLRPAGVLLGPALALVGLIVELIRGGPWRKLILPCVLAATFSLSAQVRKEFRADSGAHFAYVRSLVFDGDLDFGNEWDRWGFEVRHRTATGLERNSQSAGPALLWSPAYLVTEVYLRLDRAITGTDRYPLDGYSAPYRRSAALATMTVVVIGAALLILMMTPMVGARISTLAVVGVVLTSPVLYYALVVPTMAHGVTFGAAAALLWAWDRAHRTPSMRSWTVLGAAFGLVMICRWQGAVYGLLVLPLAVQGLARKKVRAVWLLAAAGAALLVFSPQLIAWKILFGQWITVPQGPGYLNFSSPHFLDTLISANHGFFNWTPVMLLGFLGLLFGMVRGSHPSRLLYFGSLLVFFATVWVNGSVTAWDWAAGDAFGARRFTLVVPLMALGLGSFLELSTRVLVRAPLLVPTAVLFLLFLWNVGMISHFRERKYREMAPLERVAKDQARSLRHLCQDILGWIAGDSGRAVAYEIFSAEYFYTRFNRSGTIDLRSAGENYLLKGWSTGSRRTAKRTFRRALYPEACVRIPLEGPVDLPTVITARAPQGLEQQVMTVVLNGHTLTSAPLVDRWRKVQFTMPARHLVPGENALCLRFRDGLPPQKGKRVAAHVERIQLP